MTGDLTQADIRAAAGVNDTMLAIGRILIALIFVSSGIEKFMDLRAAASAIGSKDLPFANVLAVLTAIVEAGGGLLIIVGWQTRLVALLLAIFCAVAAYFFHDFWNQPPGPQHVNNMRLVCAGNRQSHWFGACCQQQFVEFDLAAIAQRQFLAFDIECGNFGF